MNFTFIQRVRNKIKVNKKASIIDKSVIMVDCSVLIRGKNNNLNSIIGSGSVIGLHFRQIIQSFHTFHLI